MSDTQAKDLTFRLGYDFADTLQIVKQGVVQPLAGVTLTLRVHLPGATTDVFTVSFTTDTTANIATLKVPAATIAALTPFVVYHYDIRVVDSTSTTFVPVYGRIFVQPER